MRPILLAGLCTALALPVNVRAQLSVQVSMEREALMLFESIPVVVTIRNYSGRTVELGGGGESPWLSFLVSDERGATIPGVAKMPAVGGPVIPPGQALSRTINLLPYYDLRQRGTFTVRAVVDNEGMRTLSPPIKFTLMNGHELWRQMVGLPVTSGQTNEEYRTYSLVTLRTGPTNMLYAGVQNEARGLVYGMIQLGETLSLGEPTAKTDVAGHLHVLYRSGPRSYSYAEVDPNGNGLKRAVYSDMLSVPRLTTDEDGSVSVVGGEQTYPKIERVMTDAEVNPQPPQPAKPPKKKWWWPFGSGKSSAASSTNSPPSSPRPSS